MCGRTIILPTIHDYLHKLAYGKRTYDLRKDNPGSNLDNDLESKKLEQRYELELVI